jgi:amino acid transporter
MQNDADAPLRGRKPGDRRVRVERPHAPFFRYAGPGQLVARQAASRPTTPFGRAFARLKAATLGRPLANDEEIGERLSKKKALAIFSSDAISSSAYATEEILRVLLLAGAGALMVSIPVAMAIALLLAVVSISYRQVCRAYPSGGGAYIVARENLAPIFGLIAAAALLIDYVMTVAVSTSSALDQIFSIVPDFADLRVEIGLLAIGLVMVANLRGLRESGNIFAVPTYLFIGLALTIVVAGVYHIAIGEAHALPRQPNAVPLGTETLGIVLILRAFASGSVALTGVEAIANGVPAFKPPEAKNAANTMTAMAILLAILFIGITFVARAYDVVPSIGGAPSVVALVATTAFGDGPFFYLFQIATALILFLAANTSFNAFPRLAAILAEDGYMPRQFSFRGDRLAYSYGIIALAGVAALILVIFGGITTLLIPLYSVGVFVCFTLSQIGMVRHWRTVHESGWRWRAMVNGAGAVLTFVVLAIVVVEKFAGGAYLVVILIPTIVSVMLFINRQYQSTSKQLAVRPDFVVTPPTRAHRAVLPVPGINRAVVQAVNVARSISPDTIAVFIAQEADEAAQLRRQWERQVPGVPLVVVESPYRALTGPLLAYLDVLDRAWPEDREKPITFVVLPEFVARTWWERILYNQSVRRLRTALIGRPHTVVVDVPYRREGDEGAPPPAGKPGAHPSKLTRGHPPAPPDQGTGAGRDGAAAAVEQATRPGG